MKMEIYLLPFTILFVSYLMYIFFHKGKKRPILGEKQNNLSEHLKNDANLELYWSYLIFLFFGLLILISLLIIDFIL